MKKLTLISLFTLSLIYACKNEDKTIEDGSKVNTSSSFEDSLDNEMLSLEAVLGLESKIASSLRYTKDNGAFVVVKAFLDRNDKIVKIEESYNEGEGKNNGTNTFFLFKGKVFMSIAKYSETKSVPAQFIERVAYYDKNERVMSTKEKAVQFEEELDQAEYKKVKEQALSFERAKNVLDQKGEFETTFQGFVKVQALNYIIVGAPKKDAYVSSLRVDYEDEFVKTLLSNPEKYLNKKLYVQFEQVTDPTGFQYQTYVVGKFID